MSLSRNDIDEVGRKPKTSMKRITIHKASDKGHRAPTGASAPRGRRRPANRLKIGSELAAFGKRLEGMEFGPVRDRSIKPASFE